MFKLKTPLVRVPVLSKTTESTLVRAQVMPFNKDSRLEAPPMPQSILMVLTPPSTGQEITSMVKALYTHLAMLSPGITNEAPMQWLMPKKLQKVITGKFSYKLFCAGFSVRCILN